MTNNKHYMTQVPVVRARLTFPSGSSGESKLSRKERNTCSSVHSPLTYFRWWRALYTLEKGEHLYPKTNFEISWNVIPITIIIMLKTDKMWLYKVESILQSVFLESLSTLMHVIGSPHFSVLQVKEIWARPGLASSALDVNGRLSSDRTQTNLDTP